MERYNDSHCLDMTAAVAIDHADKKRIREIEKKYEGQRLTYQIGEIYFMRMIGDMLLLIDRAACEDNWWYRVSPMLATDWLCGIDLHDASRNGQNGSTIRQHGKRSGCIY